MNALQTGGFSKAFTVWLCSLALLAPMASAFAATPTTTTLSSSAGTAPVDQSIRLTATVTGASPTGTVTFKDGAATVGHAVVMS